MGHHTKECRIGERRLIKKFAWLTFCRGFVILWEDIIVEQVYDEKMVKSFFSEEPSYHWKTIKKWTVEEFERKHGQFREENVKAHGQ